MNRDSLIFTVKSIDDIEFLKSTKVKYLNVDILNTNNEVIKYLKENGSDYLYAESIDGKNGYIYVDYYTFFIGERLINSIITKIPKNLTKLEQAKYLYISLGQIVGYDINSVYEKNEKINLTEFNTINNIWGAISNYKATNQSYCKLYLYLCSLLDIKCEIITVNKSGYLCNKLLIDDNLFIVDLTKDIPFIEAGFKTRFFSNYNDEIELDKKIGYIKDDYNENKIEKVLQKTLNYDDSFILNFLLKTQKIVKVEQMKPIELGIIYDFLFQKYCPNLNIFINNLYINNLNGKKNFILISCDNTHYSYNYNKQSFITIEEKELIYNIESETIGVYLNENLPISFKYREIY